ncbi:Cys-Gln thioester bond-forming surface protein [Kitasatospora sp. NPDC093806]|uniref:thioester domain-containing protein n=1 Tax=Kitasatospora sp. NPDC093806 TaxID=3155075 RepID=UPI0034126A25
MLATSDGGTLFTYCIDLPTETKADASYQEVNWSDAPTLKSNRDAGKVNWVLQNAYPKISSGDLGKLIGGELAADDAAVATQAAIWHFSDHVTAVPENPVAARLAEYLVAHAEDVKEPTPSLTLGHTEAAGDSGAVLGPIEITSASGQVSASLDAAAVAAGVVLTDRVGTVLSDGEGKLVHPAKGGDSLYVKAPAGARPGSATVSATTSLKVPVGRAFTSPGSQSLIIAGSTVVSASAQAKASWTPAATASPSASPTASAIASPSVTASPSRTASVRPTAHPTAPVDPSPTGPSGPTGPSTSAAPSATATTALASESADDGGQLASTGTDTPIGLELAIGGGALVAGGLLFAASRRSRRRT